jgi:hypothetical protein
MTRPFDGLLSGPYGSPWLLAPPPLDVTTCATVQNATALRRTFRCWVEALVGDDVANDLTLAMYEALANAADHARLYAATCHGRRRPDHRHDL